MIYTLQNQYWQAGILPGTGASIAFGRVLHDGTWVDVLRPTPESDYGSSSNCSSFIMLPWCNRIKGGLLRFDGQEYQLRTTKDDGTARHGDVRGRAWQIVEADGTHILMSFYSPDFTDVNWPFAFSAHAEYYLENREFIWVLTLKNEDSRPMPAGFGHHPYFVRRDGVQVQIPCDQYFQLVDFMATDAPVPVPPELDFRELSLLDGPELNDLLTARHDDLPARIVHTNPNIKLTMHSDPAFEHILIFAPEGKPFFAVEPMTNASDGFNLYADGIPGSGIFVLQPGETQTATVRLGIG